MDPIRHGVMFVPMYCVLFRVNKKGKSLVWEENIVGAATIVADSRV